MSGHKRKIVQYGQWTLYEHLWTNQDNYYYAEHICPSRPLQRFPGVYYHISGTRCEQCGDEVPEAIVALFAFLHA